MPRPRNAPNLTPPECARALRALGDVTRLRIMDLLLDGPLNVGEIATALDTPPYQASRHLSILRAAGLVVAERDAQWVVYTLHPDVRARSATGKRSLDLGCCAIRIAPTG